MQYPVFPQEFVLNHCPQVLEAREWRERYDVPGTPEQDTEFAECQFKQAGSGMACESCNLHLARPFLGHEVDRKFLPLIEEYYRQLKDFEQQESEREAVLLTQGAGI